MEQHDKGIALPEETETHLGFDLSEMSQTDSAERGRERWARAIVILDVLRNFATHDYGLTTHEVAAKAKLHPRVVLGILTTLRKRGAVSGKDTSNRGTCLVWWIPNKFIKTYLAQLLTQSKDNASYFTAWTISSICARMKNGIELDFSYPYCRGQGANPSSTTSPLT